MVIQDLRRKGWWINSSLLIPLFFFSFLITKFGGPTLCIMFIAHLPILGSLQCNKPNSKRTAFFFFFAPFIKASWSRVDHKRVWKRGLFKFKLFIDSFQSKLGWFQVLSLLIYNRIILTGFRLILSSGVDPKIAAYLIRHKKGRM